MSKAKAEELLAPTHKCDHEDGLWIGCLTCLGAALEAARREGAREQAEKAALLAEGAWLPIGWGNGSPAEFDAIQRTRNGIANALRQAIAEGE